MLIRRIITSLPLTVCSVLAMVFSFSTFSYASAKVENFVLLDQHGEAHELHYLKNKKAIVLMAYSSEVPGSLETAIDLHNLDATIASDDVAFYLLDSNPSDKRSVLLQQKLPAEVTVLVDESQLIGQQLGFTHIGEVIAVQPGGWKQVYKGPIEKGDKALLKDALTALLEGKNVETTVAMSAGSTAIKYQTLATTPSYSEDIAPLLQEKCVSCHQEGGIGPWR